MKTFALSFGFVASILFIGMLLGGAIIMNQQNKQKQPKIDLPEEFMCVASDEANKPDTVLIYQSVSNDSLYIRFMRTDK